MKKIVLIGSLFLVLVLLAGCFGGTASVGNSRLDSLGKYVTEEFAPLANTSWKMMTYNDKTVDDEKHIYHFNGNSTQLIWDVSQDPVYEIDQTGLYRGVSVSYKNKQANYQYDAEPSQITLENDNQTMTIVNKQYSTSDKTIHENISTFVRCDTH